MRLSRVFNNIILSMIILFAVIMPLLLKNSGVNTETTLTTKNDTQKIKTPASVKQVSNPFGSSNGNKKNAANRQVINDVIDNDVIDQIPLISVLGINPDATKARLKLSNGMNAEYVAGEKILPDIFIHRIESTQVVFSHDGETFVIALTGRNQWPDNRPVFIDGVTSDGATSVPLALKDGHQFAQISSESPLSEDVSADGSVAGQADIVATDGTTVDGTAEGKASIPLALKDDQQFNQAGSDTQLLEGISGDGSIIE